MKWKNSIQNVQLDNDVVSEAVKTVQIDKQ